MAFFIDYQWLFLIISIFLGLTLGQLQTVAAIAGYFILPSLMVMLFGIFLQIPLQSLRAGFINVKVTGLSLAINFFWTPLLAFALSHLFFRHAPDIFIALIMDLVTPCTDWYLVFTGIAGGHLGLSTSLLPWNLFLQLFLLPFYLFLFAGAVVEIQLSVFLQSFLRVLLLPFILALVVRNLICAYKGSEWFTQNLLRKSGPLQAFFLILAVTAMFASQGRILIEHWTVVIRLLVPVTIFFMINFSLGQIVGRFFKLSYQEGASLIFTTLARNAPLALTLAVAAFPHRPLIPLVLAVESLIELPLLFVFAQLMLFIYRKKWWSHHA